MTLFTAVPGYAKLDWVAPEMRFPWLTAQELPPDPIDFWEPDQVIKSWFELVPNDAGWVRIYFLHRAVRIEGDTHDRYLREYPDLVAVNANGHQYRARYGELLGEDDSYLTLEYVKWETRQHEEVRVKTRVREHFDEPAGLVTYGRWREIDVEVTVGEVTQPSDESKAWTRDRVIPFRDQQAWLDSLTDDERADSVMNLLKAKAAYDLDQVIEESERLKR